MEDLTKTQLVLLLILVAIVVSFTTAIVTASLFEQSSSGVTGTIQTVVDKAVGTDPNKKETLKIITDEQRVIDVVRASSPAVVSIVASKDLPVMEDCYITPFGGNDVFSQFFDFRIPSVCKKGTEKRQVSAGTGFFVRDDGLLVTNRHVVQDREAEYSVVLNDKTKLSAKVLVRDPVQDIAVLKVSAPRKFSALSLGDSSKLVLAQRVIAIGNALGEFQNTVSVGVISGLRRTVVASGEELRAVIQTDAAINPGNSGGPLLNLSGEVIGINTAVAAGAENIGFALPVALVKRDIEAFEKTGKVTYPFLGVRFRIVDNGALVVGSKDEPAITKGSPADLAGLKEGDIVTELAGETITADNTLAEIIQRHKVGEKISIVFLRDGKTERIEAALTERKE